MEKNWKIIRDEAVSLLDARGQGGFQPEAEKLQDTGDWKQLTLYQQGRRDAAGCKRAPKTCGIISEMSDATGCSRGQVGCIITLLVLFIRTRCKMRQARSKTSY